MGSVASEEVEGGVAHCEVRPLAIGDAVRPGVHKGCLQSKRGASGTPARGCCVPQATKSRRRRRLLMRACPSGGSCCENFVGQQALLATTGPHAPAFGSQGLHQIAYTPFGPAPPCLPHAPPPPPCPSCPAAPLRKPSCYRRRHLKTSQPTADAAAAAPHLSFQASICPRSASG